MKNFIRHLAEQPWVIKSIPTLTAVWTALILYLTLMPADQLAVSSSLFSFSNLGHFGMFGGWTGLTGLFFLIFRNNLNPPLLTLTFFGILFGAGIEILQHIMPFNRTGSVVDIFYNSLGCFTAYFILIYIRNTLRIYAESEFSQSTISATIPEQ